jgi:hypothetical protein
MSDTDPFTTNSTLVRAEERLTVAVTGLVRCPVIATPTAALIRCHPRRSGEVVDVPVSPIAEPPVRRKNRARDAGCKDLVRPEGGSLLMRAGRVPSLPGPVRGHVRHRRDRGAHP